MADHVVASNEVGTEEFTLAAGIVDTVTFDDVDLQHVTIINCDGAAAIWYTTGDSSNVGTPAVDGKGSWYVPAAITSDDARQPQSSGETIVKLVSAGTPTVRVQRGY